MTDFLSGIEQTGGVPAAHTLGGAQHTADTLANLNTKVSDATLDEISHLDDFDANDAIFPSSNPAAAIARNNHPVLAFDADTAESVIFNGSMLRDYLAASILVDIDWVSASAVVGDVVWGIEIERIAPGAQDIGSDGFAAQITGTSTTSGTTGIITRTTITLTQAQADAITAGDGYRMRVQRVAADGGDTMLLDAQIVRVIVRQ